ncbi:MAG: agmatine deiminase family protein [Myxococcota bacterium]
MRFTLTFALACTLVAGCAQPTALDVDDGSGDGALTNPDSSNTSTSNGDLGSGDETLVESTRSGPDTATTGVRSARRVPAEWEPQAAVWLQWPQQWEVHFEPAFAEIIRAAAAHQPVHVIAHDMSTMKRGAGVLAAAAVPTQSVTWHLVPNDNAWMRDNGPRYVEVDNSLVIQDWGFDAWGGNFGPGIPFASDDEVPSAVADIVGLPLEVVDMIHERGDLEFNGTDTVIVNWSVVNDRNPDMSRAEATQVFVEAFGVVSVVYLEGYHPEDGTTGHVDGIARFISETQVVVGQLEDPALDPISAELFDDAAEQIAEQRPDLEVLRMPFPAGTDYMNWLVGNDYVISGGFDDAEADAAARARIESYFPSRTVYIVDVTALWADGGGVHCVTNDQPL